MTTKSLNEYFDHTILKPNATKAQIRALCEEAKLNHFATVCVNPYWVKEATKLLKDTGVGVTTVIGFPLGANTSSIKAQEAKQAVSDGADEIDMVINLGALIDEDDQAVLNDIQQVRQAIPNQVLKVILETGFLNEAQIIKACQLAMQAKADFVKTSTGFGPRGASVEDIKLMVKTVKPALQVKASGGIRSFADAQAMIEAGADRIGASASVAILQSQKSSKE